MGVNNPYVRFQKVAANVGASVHEQKILVLGQKVTAGTALVESLYTDLGEDVTYKTLGGAGSMINQMIDVVQKTISVSRKKPRVDAIFFDDDVAAIAAKGNILIDLAPLTETSVATTVLVIVGSEINNKYEVSIPAGSTETDIADAIVAKITADANSPVIAANLGEAITFTSNNAGTDANDLGLLFTDEATNSTSGEISATVVIMGGGTGTAGGLVQLASIVQNVRYQTIVAPASYNDIINTLLESRFDTSASGEILDGTGVIVKNITLANIKIDTEALNSKSMDFFPNRIVVGHENYRAGSLYLEFPYVIASHFGAIKALRMTQDASVGEYVITSTGSSDDVGGIAISTLPYHNTPCPYISTADGRLDWTAEEYDEIVDAGYAVFSNNKSDTEVTLGTVVTRYKYNSLGNEDYSYKYQNYVDQVSVVNEYFTNELKAEYAQFRLTQGAVVRGINMANEGSIRGECLRIYGELAAIGVMQLGQQAAATYSDALEVELDLATGRVNITMLNLIVTQVRDIEGTIQISFNL